MSVACLSFEQSEHLSIDSTVFSIKGEASKGVSQEGGPGRLNSGFLVRDEQE